MTSHNAVHIFLADLIRDCLDHDADHRLCTALTHKDTPIGSEFICHSLNCRLNSQILPSSLLVSHTDIL